MKHTNPAIDSIEERVAEAVERRLRPFLDRLEQPPAPAPIVVQADPTADRFVPLTEAASILGVHRTTALRYEHIGTLPTRVKMGSRTGWRMSDLQRVLQDLPGNPPLRGARKALAS